ncbi:MAG: 50S ribosomal protein L23 [Cryomorphaceae bacterium]|nr:MAG: 50S ribosomal protein L23 [Cryomorphaceae bacterium]
MSRILIKPIITEKMTDVSERLNRYGFVVDRRANKIQIGKAVEDAYGVVVDKVWTINYAGKNKSKFTKTGMVKGRTNAYKKAIVTLSEGEIDIYGNI